MALPLPHTSWSVLCTREINRPISPCKSPARNSSIALYYCRKEPKYFIIKFLLEARLRLQAHLLPLPHMLSLIFNEPLILSHVKVLGYATVTHICGTVPYLPAMLLLFFLSPSKRFLLSSLFSLPQEARALLLPYSSYTSRPRPLQRSVTPRPLGCHSLRMTVCHAFPFLPWALCSRSSRCSFLNKIMSILKILPSTLNSTAIHLLCIIILMINQLRLIPYQVCAY